MTPSGIRAPPLSFRPMTGAPTFIAVSMILTILFACISPRLPPKTVKSCEKTKTVRPSIVPCPVTTPSPGIRFASIPKSVVRCSTKASVSTKLPGSRGDRAVPARSASPSCAAPESDLCPRLLGPGLSVGAARPCAHRPPWSRRTRSVSLILRARLDEASRSSCASQGLVSDSLEDLERAFKELVLRALVVHNDERPVRCDVVRLAGQLLFSDRHRDPLSDRRALPAVVLQKEFDPRVAVAGIQVVDLV